MQLHLLDYIILIVYFGSMLAVGFWSFRRAGKNSSEYFLSGRNMTWWLLGFSLVATTFAADTPNLVTGLVRQSGVAGNWCWWAFLLTGMTTVFIYAKLWRRLNVMTDIEFYEVRYSGKPAVFLRGFRTIYLGLIFNTFVMANVILAIIKILNIMLGIDPIVTVIFASVVTVLFTVMGGLSAVIWADFILFIISMVGAVAAAVYVLYLPQVNGLSGLLSNPNVVDKLSVLPNFADRDAVIALLLIPLAVQWWSTWYPGAEPGGGSFGTQRMFAAKNESHAIGATLFFNFCHYAIRPWPWIIVALASLIVYPDLASLKTAFPGLPESMIKDDMAYPAMLNFLPAGLFGLMIASLFAAFMSTIATLLNLGSSYMVNDFYHRFINQNASEKQLVLWGRIWTLILMILACTLAMFLEGAVQNFEILLMIGAGTGLIFLLRWFWWRINAYSEIAAMIFALISAIYFKMLHFPLWSVMGEDGVRRLPEAINFSSGTQLILGVAVTTIGWIVVTVLTPPTSQKTLLKFLIRVNPGGPGWKHVINKFNETKRLNDIAQNEQNINNNEHKQNEANWQNKENSNNNNLEQNKINRQNEENSKVAHDITAVSEDFEEELKEFDKINQKGGWTVPLGILCSVIGCVAVYAALFASGALIYGHYGMGFSLLGISTAGSFVLFKTWNAVKK